MTEPPTTAVYSVELTVQTYICLCKQLTVMHSELKTVTTQFWIGSRKCCNAPQSLEEAELTYFCKQWGICSILEMIFRVSCENVQIVINDRYWDWFYNIYSQPPSYGKKYPIDINYRVLSLRIYHYNHFLCNFVYFVNAGCCGARPAALSPGRNADIRLQTALPATKGNTLGLALKHYQ